MKRLFISLYVAIVFGLLVINASSESIWQWLSNDTDVEYPASTQAISQLITPLQLIYKIEGMDKLDTLLQQQTIPYALANRDNFAFLDHQLSALERLEPVFLFTSAYEAEIYVPLSNNDLLVLGPLPIDDEPQTTSWMPIVIKIMAYGLLAVFIFAWSYPVWRDLNTLSSYTEKVSSGDLTITNTLKPHSIVYPLGNAFETMARRIRELLSFQKQMMQAVSHDIRTPLARLKFSLAIAKSQQGIPDQENGSNSTVNHNMLTDINEIEQLVEEMLTYGRLETATPELSIENVNISELSQHLIDKLNRNNAIQISFDCPANTYWHCDGYLLERALQNLLTNAQRYAVSQVYMSVSTNQNKLDIKIKDDGCGIPDDQKENIFTPFTRLEGSRNKASGGFGLGLAIVSKIIHWHDGKVTVSNNKTTGATFTISL